MTALRNVARRSGAALAALLLGAALASEAARAAARIPERDDEVLETLPLAVAGSARELRALSAALAADPLDAARAVDVARRYLAIGRAESDPRYLGWAEGCLAPWAGREDAPRDVLLLRAPLRQSRHDFDGALEDLDALLARDPRAAQAWLVRAVILEVRGDPEGARRSCAPLLRLARGLLPVTCLANAESLAGRAEASATALA